MDYTTGKELENINEVLILHEQRIKVLEQKAGLIKKKKTKKETRKTI